MNDIFSSYQHGITELLNRLGKDHPDYLTVLTLQDRLKENIVQVRLYGDTETHRATRAQILDTLNHVASQAIRMSFSELRMASQSSPLSPAEQAAPAQRDRQRESPVAAVNSPLVALPACPFVAGPKITDPRLFVGRKAELRRLVSAMEGAQPVSINVVGERRIGKSSLLYHLCQTWEQRVQSPARYVVAFLSLQEADAQTENSFYRAVARTLRDRPMVQGHPEVAAALNERPIDRPRFASLMRELRRRRLLPILCLDEFEALLKYPHQFNDGFYDALRALMDDNVLMLVLASLQPLDVYRRRQGLTSSFFNLGHMLRLTELTDDEAAELVCLPASTVPGAPAALSIEAQRLARQWGGGHPCLLQLAGCFLCQARQEGKDVAWARAQFEAEARRVPRAGMRLARVGQPLRRLALDTPWRLGDLARRLGDEVDEAANWIVGMVILVVIALALLGILTRTQLVDLLHQALGR